MQQLHRDFETTLPQTEYFVLGNGRLQVVLQWSAAQEATPVGLLLSEPAHFSRKWSTHLFHPEYGLARTMPALFLNGERHVPRAGACSVRWMEDPREGLEAQWSAGDCTVSERLWVPREEAMLVREFSVEGATAWSEATLELALYANPVLYTHFTAGECGLAAVGYRGISLTTDAPCTTFERTMRIALTRATPNCTVVYHLQDAPQIPSVRPWNAVERDQLRAEVRASWRGTTEPIIPAADPFERDCERLFAASVVALRGAISTEGAFDASLFQYGFEWSGDASMVCEALIYAGEFERARAVLGHLLTELTNDEGMARESSRFRGGADAELNNNGEILGACALYLEWTGDLAFSRQHYERIRAVAEYLLRPEFLDAQSGLLIAARDIWERSAAVGILPGFDIAHQGFGIDGLAAAARVAEACGQVADASRWQAAAERMRMSLLMHPTLSMIQDGHIIKRRLPDGSVQRALAVSDDAEFLKHFVPSGMPLAEGHDAKPWEPDISACFPITLGIVDGASDVARATVEEMDALWSQAWEGGGYGRYNVLSEPDSPGPWPFATAFVAAAALEVGDEARARRAIEWLIARAGEGRSFFEFYGERPTPPLPPTGLIVWGWAQFITLIVRHVLAVRIESGRPVASRRLGFRVPWQLRFREAVVEL